MRFVVVLVLLIAFKAHSNTCLIGNNKNNFYSDSFQKSLQNPYNSILKLYKERQESLSYLDQSKNFSLINVLKLTQSTAPLNLSDFSKRLKAQYFSSQKEWITHKEIECSLKKTPYIKADIAICSRNAAIPKISKNLPCITQDMVDYMHFVVNQAFRCFNNKMDDFTKQILLKKINQESSFGFFFADQKGKGIMQFVSIAAYEMSSPDHSGFQYLSKQIQSHPLQCGVFESILQNNQNESPRKMNTCSYVNFEEGVARSLIQGLGMYFYYRDEHPLSAKNTLKWLGLKPSKNENYQRMLATLALGMYNKGPGIVSDSIKFFFSENELKNYKKNMGLALNKFITKIENSNFYIYVEDANKNFEKTYSQAEITTCKI